MENDLTRPGIITPCWALFEYYKYYIQQIDSKLSLWSLSNLPVTEQRPGDCVLIRRHQATDYTLLIQTISSLSDCVIIQTGKLLSLLSQLLLSRTNRDFSLFEQLYKLVVRGMPAGTEKQRHYV